ncbi:MAG: LysR family transcriptional regulator [Opitutaceae bacterium]|nr:LysR family transcriptional regulator [Opitutaceae bacterium]
MRHLRYFVAVAEELNFRRAAERLHVSSPALSVQIRMLEELLGVRLFERDTKRVSLTGPGEVLLREAQSLLRQARGAIAATQEAASGKRGTLRVGCAGRLGYSFMPATLDAFRKRFPEVELIPVDLDIEMQQAGALEKGDIHVGFAYGAYLRGLAGIDHAMVLDSPMRAVMGAAHPLAGARALSLAELAGRPLMALSNSRTHAASIQMMFLKRNLEPGPVRPVEGFEAFVSMLAGGTEVSFLPDMGTMARVPCQGQPEAGPSARAVSNKEGMIVFCPLKDKGVDLRLQLHAIWKAAGRSPLVMNFVAALRESVRLASDTGAPDILVC